MSRSLRSADASASISEGSSTPDTSSRMCPSCTGTAVSIRRRPLGVSTAKVLRRSVGHASREHETGVLEPVDRTGQPRRRQRRLRGEIAHAQPPARRAGEAEQDLEPLDGQPAVPLEPAFELARQPGMRLQQQADGGDVGRVQVSAGHGDSVPRRGCARNDPGL